MFLLRSVHDITSLDKELQVSILLAAARKGFPPAQGVVRRVIDSYGMQATNLLTDNEIETWLKNAVASGFRPPTCAMERIAPQDLETNRAIFCSNSGYNQFYSPIAGPRCVKVSPTVFRGYEGLPYDEPTDRYRNRLIHQLAVYGEIEQIEALLDNNLSEINCTNDLGETALYKACLSGRADIVLFLCQKGADASLTVGGRRITCLHWLFNFPASYTDRVVCAMIAAGADPNASLTGRGSLINYHFPLRWPPGTPMHWAVAVSSLEAVKALIGQGADLLVRNRQDPYKADENVRQLNSHGTAEQGEFSETPETCLGLNPIDLAVANHDWRVLEEMSSSYQGSTFDLFAVDEESYSPFHRLSLNRITNTVTGSRFWYPAFMGAPAARKNNIRKTVQALKRMGGDINQITGSPSTFCLSGVSGARGGLSPLMIAVTKSDFEVVEILCEEGADVNLQNRCGHTALTFMRDLDVAGSSPPGSISAITRSLVDHGAEVNYRSPNGVTPVLCASSSGDLDAVKILAENGVDLTSRTGLLAMAHMIIGMGHLKNMQHSSLSITESEQREINLALFMENYVKPAVRSNALLVGDRGKTLLHCCANAALFACVKVLTVAGSSLNAIEEPGTEIFVEGCTISTRYHVHGTPLDVVILDEKLLESTRSEKLSQASKCTDHSIETPADITYAQKLTISSTNLRAFVSS
jgi:ankyrin repeat protein